MKIAKLLIAALMIQCSVAPANCAEPYAKAFQIPAQIRPALGELRVSKTPVMLPTWLPASCTGPLGVGSGPFKSGYELWLGTCSADTTLFLSAGKGRPNKRWKKVRLKNGRFAYIQDLKDFCMEWADNGYVYRIGYPSWGKKKDVEIMTRIANSMKKIAPTTLNAEPVGEDRLAKAYKEGY